MTILADLEQNGVMIQVQVLDVFEGSGRKLATVQALQGKPFTRWTMGGPCDDDTDNVRPDRLHNVRVIEAEAPAQAARPNLLTMALEYRNRAQWYSGESVRLITGKTGQPLAWLKHESGRVYLQAAGKRGSVLIYVLHPDGWRVAQDVTRNYQAWAR